jgi:putative serine protease PepD
VVRVVQGGPAAAAGIRAGDIITAINGTPTPDTNTLAQVLATLKPGATATVRVQHPDGSVAAVKVVLGSQ